MKKRLIKTAGIFAIAFGTFFYFFNNNPSHEGSAFIRCPSNALLGVNCPGCGSQRALHHLFHLEIEQALQYNGLLILFFPLLMYVLAIWCYNFIFNQHKSIRLLNNNRILLGFFIIIVVYGILRNIAIYPFTLLAPPL